MQPHRIIPRMTNAETPRMWWTYDYAPTRWAIVGSLVVAWLFACLFLYSDVAKILAARPWWEDFIVALATIAVPVLAFLELRHSAEANELRRTANELRREQIALEDRLGQLMVERDMERNKHLEQIASNTLRQKTPAERNAEMLRGHLGSCVSVTEGQGAWPSTPLIAEVSEANIVTLFTPSAGSNPQAWYVQVDCGELEIADTPHGSCPLMMKVLKRYGPNVPLGEITKWEDRRLPSATPKFIKGGNVHYQTFTRPGETRTLYVYASSDGSNSFLLEASTGETTVADNVEISKRFVLLAVDYLAAGFSRGNSGTSGASIVSSSPRFEVLKNFSCQ